MSDTPSKIIPRMITHETGIKLMSGEFVEIDGMYCKIPFTIKNRLIMLFSCWNNDNGKKFHLLYFVELILFVAKSF